MVHNILFVYTIIVITSVKKYTTHGEQVTAYYLDNLRMLMQYANYLHQRKQLVDASTGKYRID